jgi:hypothetical protein
LAAYETGGLEHEFEDSPLSKGNSRVRRKLFKEVKVTSVVPQSNVFGAPLYLVYVHDIWRMIDWSIRLFVDESIIYGKHTNKNHMVKLQKDLNTLGNGQ